MDGLKYIIHKKNKHIMSDTVNVKFWQGTNFWTALVLLVGGFFVGFPQGEASGAVAGIFAVVATVFGIREKVKGTVPFKEWLSSSNTWNYIGAAVVAILPSIPLELFSTLKDIMQAAVGGNWQGIAVGVFSLATILYNLFKKK